MRSTAPRRFLLPVALAAILALAPVAGAAQMVLDPPGKAGANEYFETIPTSNGNAAPSSGGGGTPAIDSDGPGAAALKHLEKLGAAGQAAASFATANAPPVTDRPSGSGGSGRNGSAGTSGAGGHPPATEHRGTAAPDARTASGGSALGAIFGVLGGSDAGGIGVVMPVLLIGGLLVAIVGAARRRGQGDSSSAPTP